MRKLALILALTAGALMPITAVAQDSSSSSSKKKRSKKSKKSAKSENSRSRVEAPKEELPPPPPPAQSFSNEQIMLNNQAVVATREENFVKAEQLFNAMLQIGEFNIIWMNLGRTYTSQNKCLEAADAFARVATAPPIADFPPEVINEKTEGYIRDLNDQCSSSVILKCNPADAMITIDGGMERMCSPEPLKLTPGHHAIYAKTSYGFNTVVVDTHPYETTTVDVAVVDYEQVVSDAGLSLDVLYKQSKLFKSVGYSMLGVGAAALAAGFGIMGYTYFVYDPRTNSEEFIGNTGEATKRKNHAHTLLDTSYGVVAAGGVMVAIGLTLVIIDAVKYMPQIKNLEAGQTAFSDFRFSPVVSPEFSGFTLGASF